MYNETCQHKTTEIVYNHCKGFNGILGTLWSRTIPPFEGYSWLETLAVGDVCGL